MIMAASGRIVIFSSSRWIYIERLVRIKSQEEQEVSKYQALLEYLGQSMPIFEALKHDSRDGPMHLSVPEEHYFSLQEIINYFGFNDDEV
jgi:hypothetical protein